jgi:hypothetical protein
VAGAAAGAEKMGAVLVSSAAMEMQSGRVILGKES